MNNKKKGIIYKDFISVYPAALENKYEKLIEEKGIIYIPACEQSHGLAYGTLVPHFIRVADDFFQLMNGNYKFYGKLTKGTIIMDYIGREPYIRPRMLIELQLTDVVRSVE